MIACKTCGISGLDENEAQEHLEQGHQIIGRIMPDETESENG